MYPLSIGLVIETKSLWEDIQPAISDLPIRIVLEQSEVNDWGPFLEKIERMRPDVVLVDLTTRKDTLEEFVGRVRATSVAPSIFALHTVPDPELILKALRCGVTEYLYPPVKNPLNAALERVSAERNRTQQSVRPGGRVLGFVSAKGGCGATTISCHTAVSLASRTGNKVLLADFDMDAGMVGFLMKAKSTYTVLDALKNVHRLDANYWNALISNGIPNLEILASPAPPAAASSVTSEQIRYTLRFGRTQYDWIIVDLGRSLTELSFRTIEESDELFLVTTMEVPALHKAKQLLQKLLDTGYGSHRIRLVLNRAPKRSDISLDELRSIIGIPVYATIGNDYDALQESYSEGRLAPPGSSIGRQFEGLAVKIAGIDAGKQKKKFSLF